MTINGFSIFGFDLFGLTRPAPDHKEKASSNAEVKQRDDQVERDYSEIEPETFLWGMYPVY